MRLGDLIPSLDLSDDMAAIDIAGLTADSRTVRSGYLFAALPGSSVDGMRFAPQAVEQGAAAILAPDGGAPGDDLPVPVVRCGDPRAALAHAAATFYRRQPEVMVAVTGTNGKTSVVAFLRQIWQSAGYEAASLGTIGVVTADGARSGGLTTPDPVSLHQTLRDLADEGITHAAIEASSHGLAQRRLDGVRIKAAAFTNISRDHLDYHPTFEDYLSAKLRLFTDLLPADGIAVVDADEAHAEAVVEAARSRGQRVFTVGEAGDDIKVLGLQISGYEQHLTVSHDGRRHWIRLPLAGRFQVSNALIAAGLAIATGVKADDAIASLCDLRGAKGRLDLVAKTAEGAPVLVDYAHTPDALENALSALRPVVKGRLIVVFGAGGDRDPGKRPLMGAAASRIADLVIVTDDNPRTEDPAVIRKAVIGGAPEGIEVAGRVEAISHGISMLGADDALLVAGKGHESGQDFGDHVVPFSDHDVIMDILGAEQGS